jgi:ribonucleoside-diphosphate reductase alpha subunit
MHVKKRNGNLEEVSFDKVINRIKKMCNQDTLLIIEPIDLAQNVCSRIYDNVSTSELDELTAQLCASHITDHPDYGILASRIIISNHQKKTSPSFSETISILFNTKTPLISEELYKIVEANKDKLNSVINYDRDFKLDFFGFKTLERSYLLKMDNKTIERPQHMFMRVALGIHGEDIKDAIETYEMMSQKYFIHATPTLFNSGTKRPQMASCFLQAMKNDSIDGIFDTLKSCANISKYSGGIGLHIHDVRGKGSYIRGTNGVSNGIIPMLSVYNKTAMYVDQCFRGDTHIYLQDVVKKIENIKEGDMVLTADGTYKKVLKTVKTYINKETLRIRTKNSIDTIYLTQEHQIYTIINTPSIAIEHMQAYLKENIHIKFDYVSAKNLTLFDYVGYPIPLNEDSIIYDRDDCIYSGYLLSNGHIKNNICIVSFYKGKRKEFFINYLTNKNVKFTDINNEIRFEINEDCEPISNYFALNKENTISFLYGCLDSAGCNISEKYQCMFFNTRFKSTAYIIKYLFLKLKILVDGFYKKDFNNYIIIIPYTKLLFDMFKYTGSAKITKILTYFEFDGILWTPIKSIDKMNNYEGHVYDLNIEDNHNYVTEMGIVHNSGKRNGNFAIYLEPSHPDIETFIDLRKNHGNESERCRELFTALWIPDLFMKRIKNDEMWSLMCPDECKGLSSVYGDEYEKLYIEYEKKGMFKKQIKAQELWINICKAQIETGTPYICFKDSCNQKSNQKNIGTIKSSNLCAEIIEYSNENETAVCNLASIALPMYIKDGKYDFEALKNASGILCKNLNKVIDRTFYPTEETKNSNKKHRPIGIGVQGLADTYAILGYPFDSKEASELNKQIFETIYYGALTVSCDLSKKYGTYETYINSPVSKGILQYDMWNVKPSDLWDWDKLKKDISEHGIRNSLLIALMPTASTSQILGFNECFEPFTSNIYQRRTLAGEFFVINKYLINKLVKMKLWNKNMKSEIMDNNGSIQNIESIPNDIKAIFKTVWEIKPKVLIDQSVDRSPYVCQSQSMNIFIEEPNIERLSNMHFYSWSNGLKTGIYYLRTKPQAKTLAFTGTIKKDAYVSEISEICESCSA